MIVKALLKKQLQELLVSFFYDRRTGKRRSKGGIVGYGILFGFVFLMLFVSFFSMAFAVGVGFLESESDWMYYALMGSFAILLGLFGSVFNTYSKLYLAKDNEFLLSMPIPAKTILFARMTGVYLLAFLFSSFVWIPAVLVRWILYPHSVLGFVFPVLLWFLIPLFISVLTCFLGWIIALISVRLKNKSLIVVLISVVFLAGYWYFCMNTEELTQKIIDNADVLAGKVQTGLYPIYQLALGAAGKTLGFLIFTAITLAAFALLYTILSVTFLRITTVNRGAKKKVYVAKKEKAVGTGKALFRREGKHFLSSPTYMLNAGFGLLLMPVCAVVMLVRMRAFRAMLEGLGPEMGFVAKMIPGAALGLMCILIGFSTISAPSVSLEGKNLWLIRSLPVSSREILRSKVTFHAVLCAVPASVSVVVLGIAMGMHPLEAAAQILPVAAFSVFTGELGVIFNLKNPDLNWTTEAMAVKQGMSVLFSGLIGFGAAIVILSGGVAFALFLPTWVYALIVTAVLTVVCMFFRKWLDDKGVRLWESL